MTKLQNTLAGRITVLALFAASLACGVSASTANISDAYLARDPEGTDPTTVFLPDEPFYLIVELANAPDDTVVKAVWVAVDVVYIAMFVFKRLYLTAGLYTVFLVLAVMGYIQWKRSLAERSLA